MLATCRILTNIFCVIGVNSCNTANNFVSDLTVISAQRIAFLKIAAHFQKSAKANLAVYFLHHIMWG